MRVNRGAMVCISTMYARRQPFDYTTEFKINEQPCGQGRPIFLVVDRCQKPFNGGTVSEYRLAGLGWVNENAIYYDIRLDARKWNKHVPW